MHPNQVVNNQKMLSDILLEDNEVTPPDPYTLAFTRSARALQGLIPADLRVLYQMSTASPSHLEQTARFRAGNVYRANNQKMLSDIPLEDNEVIHPKPYTLNPN